MTRVSVVIRCYNEEKHIGRLLTGIMEQSVRDVDVVVVDSGSTDATTRIAARFPTRLVTIRPDEFTFGRSLNRGVAEAEGDIVVLASAHTYPVYRDWLERLVAPFAEPDIALTYGRQIGNELTRYSEHRIFEKLFPADGSGRQQHPFCNNANAAIRKSVWSTLPYDEELTGLEDLDWAARAIARGHALAYVADAPLVHVHEETARRIYNRYKREAIALRRIFPAESFSLLDFVRLCPANVWADCRRAARDGVLTRRLADIVVFRTMQFWGTYRGFSTSPTLTGSMRRKFYYPHDAADAVAREDVDAQRLIRYGDAPKEAQVGGDH